MHEDQHPSVAFEQTREGAEETTILVVDKIISVSEVTCEKVETDHTTHQDKLELHNFVTESDLGISPNDEKQVIQDSCPSL